MINVFPAGALSSPLGYKTAGQGGNLDVLPVPPSPPSTTPVPANMDLLLIFNVTTLTGTSPTLQVVVEQLIAGLWQAVTGGTQTAVSATGLYTYLVRGGFGIPWRVRIVDGGTVTSAQFTLSRWAGTPSA